MIFYDGICRENLLPILIRFSNKVIMKTDPLLWVSIPMKISRLRIRENVLSVRLTFFRRYHTNGLLCVRKLNKFELVLRLLGISIAREVEMNSDSNLYHTSDIVATIGGDWTALQLGNLQNLVC